MLCVTVACGGPAGQWSVKTRATPTSWIISREGEVGEGQADLCGVRCENINRLENELVI